MKKYVSVLLGLLLILTSVNGVWANENMMPVSINYMHRHDRDINHHHICYPKYDSNYSISHLRLKNAYVYINPTGDDITVQPNEDVTKTFEIDNFDSIKQHYLMTSYRINGKITNVKFNSKTPKSFSKQQFTIESNKKKKITISFKAPPSKHFQIDMTFKNQDGNQATYTLKGSVKKKTKKKKCNHSQLKYIKKESYHTIRCLKCDKFIRDESHHWTKELDLYEHVFPRACIDCGYSSPVRWEDLVEYHMYV